MVVVGIGCDDVAGHPTTVKWGKRYLELYNNRNPGGYDIAASLWVLPRVKKPKTADLTATWSTSIAERAMVITEVVERNRVDRRAGNNNATATTSPTTSLTPELRAPDDFAIAFFVSEGPEGNDDPGSAEIRDAGVYGSATIGQRAGTNGSPPVSNVTITEAYRLLATASATEGRLVGATSRRWISLIAALGRGRDDLGYGAVSVDDWNDIDDLFEDLDLDVNLAVLKWNAEEGRHEVFLETDVTTRIGYYDGDGWVAG